MTRKHTKAPFPYFGGKQHAGLDVWAALGDVARYVGSEQYAFSHQSGMAVRWSDDYDDACALARQIAELLPCPVDDKTARAMSHGRRRRSRAYTQRPDRVHAVRRAYTEEHDDVSADS